MTNTLEDNVTEYKEISSPISTIHFMLYKQEHTNAKRYSSITSLAVISDLLDVHLNIKVLPRHN